MRNSVQQQRRISCSPVCTVHLEIETESCGFARNHIKLRRFVVLTQSRAVCCSVLHCVAECCSVLQCANLQQFVSSFEVL